MRSADRHGRTALHHCIENQSPKICAALLNADLSLLDVCDCDGNSAIQLAVIAGNETVVRFLLKLGADVRTRDRQLRTVIHWAARMSTRFVCSNLLRKATRKPRYRWAEVNSIQKTLVGEIFNYTVTGN